MPLPVQKATIAASPTTVGGLPAVEFPNPEPVNYGMTVSGGWLRGGVDLGGTWPFDGVAIGLADALGSPGLDPADPISGQVSFALPIAPVIDGQPQPSDVPGAMIAAREFGPDGGLPLLTIPVPFPAEFTPEGYTPGDDVWGRVRVVTEQGREILIYAYLRGGIPAAFGEAVTAWIGVKDGETFRPFVSIELPDPADPEDPPAFATEHFDGIQGLAPATRKAVAVAQARPDVPLTIEGIEGGTPVAVDAEIAVPEGGLPVIGVADGEPVRVSVVEEPADPTVLGSEIRRIVGIDTVDFDDRRSVRIEVIAGSPGIEAGGSGYGAPAGTVLEWSCAPGEALSRITVLNHAAEDDVIVTATRIVPA